MFLMLIVVSPAKKLDYATALPVEDYSMPTMLDKAQELIDILKDYSPQQVATLMGLSDKLAGLNVARYGEWTLPFTEENARQAILAFKGDVYAGMDAYAFKKTDFNFAQKHLKILSGLYGLLNPLDLIQPYRLEMGTKLASKAGKNLYDFWDSSITEALNEALAQQKDKHAILVNLASAEYFKSVKKKQLAATVITPVFKDEKAGTYKVVGIYAKRARGLMVNYIVKNRIKDVEGIKAFDIEGYRYNPAMSDGNEWVFSRTEKGRA